MTRDRWERLCVLLDEVDDRTDGLFHTVTDQASQDHDLRRELETILANQTNGGNVFLESPIFSITTDSQTHDRIFEPGERVGSRWTIIQMVGAGGMGEVYQASDSLLKEDVALKTIRLQIAGDEVALKRFQNEIRVARKIGHPNICQVYEIFTHAFDDGSNIPFVSMEFIDGKTLASRLELGPVTYAEALPIVQQIVDGLGAAHAKRIVHSDLKTTNIMLTKGKDGNDHVVITDFGLARMLIHGEGTEELPAGGTPGYMAPEQWTGHGVTPLSDVYSLGVVMHELVTGSLPFQRSRSTEVRFGKDNPFHFTDDRCLSLTLDPKWRAVILRCIETDPARRFQSVYEVAEAITGDVHRSAHTTNRRTLFLSLATLTSLGVGSMAWLRSRQTAASVSILILPFEAKRNSEAERYTIGLVGDLVGGLTRIDGVRVLTSNGNNQNGVSPAEIARKLNVSLIVQGSAEILAENIQVVVQVFQPSANRVVLYKTFKYPRNDAFTLTEVVRREVVNAIKPTSRESSRRPPHVPNPAAYESYTEGRYLWYNRGLDPANPALAAERFERAIQLDPEYPEPYAGLIDAYGITGGPVGKPPEAMADLFRQLAAKALSLDPDSPDVLAASSNTAQHLDYDWKKAEINLRRSLLIQPGNASLHHRYAGLLSDLGRPNEAMIEFDRAEELDPFSLPIKSARAICLFYARKFKESKALIERLLAGPRSYRLYPYLGAIYQQEGNVSRALEAYQRGVLESHGDDIALAHQAYALGICGRTKEALAIVRRLPNRNQKSFTPFYVALVYGSLLRYDAAFDFLNQAFAVHDWNLTLLKVHPYCDILRKHDPARFNSYLDRLHLT